MTIDTGLANVTLVCRSQRVVHRWSIANVDTTELYLTKQVAEVKKKTTHFFHPASERHSAYIFPIDPIPIRPMVGCSSIGVSGVTSGCIMTDRCWIIGKGTQKERGRGKAVVQPEAKGIFL